MTAPATSKSTAVVTTEPAALSMALRSQSKALVAFGELSTRALIEPLLPAGDSFDRVVSEVYLAIRKNPELEKCTPVSLVESTARILTWGLTIGEGAFLVPYNVKVSKSGEKDKYESRAQAIRGYQGVCDMIWRATGIRVDAHCVYEKEIEQGRFDYEQGSHPRVVHRPILVKAQRGKVVGAYARAMVKGQPPLVLWMDVDEIDAIRQKSSKSWKEHWVDGKKVPLPIEEIPWYLRKSVILQIAKYLAKERRDGHLARTVEAEEAEEIDVTDMAEVSEPGTDNSQWEDATVEPQAETTHSAAWLFELPFGSAESGLRGKPIGSLSEKELDAARRYAKAKGGYQAFLDASDELLEERRSAAVP